ncbi:MAG TPA: lipid-A-disaccharide synthase [Methylomirabilota bacterium]|jgi:lipid-A-disaccharide synthase
MATPADSVAGGPSIMIVAGEASGDLHGATLSAALRAQAPGCHLFGMGGRRMASAGVELLADVTAAAVVGHTEAIGRLPALYRTYRRLRDAIAGARRPAALVLIDFPEFNFRLARVARRAGVPVVYFIPPQLWAWRRGRLKTMREWASLVIAVFPFEVPLYREAGIPVAYVGHPLLDAVADAPSRKDARRRLGLEGDAPVIGLLPGSRPQEIETLLPVMVDAVARIGAARPDARFVLGVAASVRADDVERRLGRATPVRVSREGAPAVIRAADVLLVTSGTVTLEAALLGTPMVVCYRMSRVSSIITRLLIRIPWFSLVNIVLGRTVVPELFQDNANGERLAAEALALLGDAGVAQREAFAEMAGHLGEPGVGGRAARLVLATAGATP